MKQQCKTKIAYATKAKAMEAIQNMNKKRSSFRRSRKGYNGSTLNVYKCPHCLKFHVGNTI